MEFLELKRPRPRRHLNAFTLIEMLVVIAIMAILMTAGAIGPGGLGGKNVTSGVASAESLFDEARTIAVGQRLNARVLVCKDLTDKATGNTANRATNNLRRVLVVSEALNTDGTRRLNPDGTPALDQWVLSSRGTLLSDQVYFSQEYSKKDLAGAGGPLDEMTLTGAKAYDGEYYYYEFNAEGICTTPGASFVIGSGARNPSAPTAKPKVTAAGKRDFGGFVVWRNGQTSVFRSPDQISAGIKTLSPGDEF